jgi:hypothetical protein
VQALILLAALLLANNLRGADANDSHNNNNISNEFYFRHIGELLPTTATIHVVSHLDYEEFWRMCETLKKPLTNESFTETTRTHEARNLHRSLHRSVTTTCADVDQLTAHHRNSSHRYRRQLDIIGGAIAIGFGVYLETQIHQLNSQVETLHQDRDQLRAIIRQGSQRINMATQQLKEQSAAIRELHTVMETHLKEEERLQWVKSRLHQVHEFAHHVHRATSGQQQLRAGRLTTDIFSKSMAKQILKDAREQARSLGGFPIIEHHEQLYQLPVTLTATGPFQWQLQLHINVIRERLQLLRYRPSVINIRDGNNKSITLQPDPVNTILAHGSNLHAELSAEDLLECDRRGRTYICDHLLALHTKDRATCLGSLHAGDGQKIQQFCHLRTPDISWTAEATASGELTVLFREPTTARNTCATNNKPNMILHGNSVIKLGPGCRLIGDDFELRARTDVIMAGPTVTNLAGNASSLLLHHCAGDISAARERLQQHRLRPAEDIEEMLDQVAILDTATKEKDDIHLFITAWWCLFAVNMCILVGFIIRVIVVVRQKTKQYG